MTPKYLLTAFVILFASLPCLAQSSGIDYFKGAWTVNIKDGPAGGFRWELREALDGSWLGGSVTREDNKVTNDYWRRNGEKIERFAFSAGGLFLKISSSGWKDDKLVFTGTASNNSGEFEVRETITKIDGNKFHALWERRNTGDPKWTVFSDETCARQTAVEKK